MFHGYLVSKLQGYCIMGFNRHACVSIVKPSMYESNQTITWQKHIITPPTMHLNCQKPQSIWLETENPT
jgi:hypothetical protein